MKPQYNIGFFKKFRYEKWICNVIHLELWAKSYGKNNGWESNCNLNQSLKPQKQSSNDFQIEHNASLESFFKGFNSICDSFLIEVHMHELWIQNIVGFIIWAKLGNFKIPYQKLCNTFHHYSATFIVVHKIYYKKI